MTAGRTLIEEKVLSKYLGTNRTVRVYLPPSYERAPRRRYPVLYLHDGQNVFSAAGTNCCFGWGSWELDRIVDHLSASNRMQEIILVAVDNSRARYAEFRGPFYSDEPGDKRKSDPGRFDLYAQFLVRELKPKIDRKYRTRPAAAHTAVMGSSLGGICSLALAWENPKIFGGAASLSGSYQIEKANFLEKGLRPYTGRRKPIRIYLDSGVIDFTGDDDGRRYTAAVADQLRRIGWKDGKQLQHFVDAQPLSDAELERAGLRRDKWAEARTSQHNEFYWRQRAWRALEFLFPPP
jgi:predicted alpha/beta superfamily hydrolase